MPATLSYKDRTRFTSEVVEAKMRELGIPTEYPSESDFDEEQILTAIDDLTDSNMWEDVATLKSGNYPAAVIVAFANVAKELKSEIFSSYGELKVRRPTTSKQRREFALSNLRSSRSQERHDDAIRVLIRETDF